MLHWRQANFFEVSPILGFLNEWKHDKSEGNAAQIYKIAWFKLRTWSSNYWDFIGIFWEFFVAILLKNSNTSNLCFLPTSRPESGEHSQLRRPTLVPTWRGPSQLWFGPGPAPNGRRMYPLWPAKVGRPQLLLLLLLGRVNGSGCDPLTRPPLAL